MNKRSSSSAFTYHVLSKVDPQIMESLTQNQLKAIHDAIAAQAILSRHPFDVRGTIPLFFIRYYFVVLMGRDMRPKTRVREHYRRREGDVWANFALVCFILIPLGLLVFLLFYYFLLFCRSYKLFTFFYEGYLSFDFYLIESNRYIYIV